MSPQIGPDEPKHNEGVGDFLTFTTDGRSPPSRSTPSYDDEDDWWEPRVHDNSSLPSLTPSKSTVDK